MNGPLFSSRPPTVGRGRRPRLNVALSRGRLGLVIVGDDQFAYSARGDNPFRKVLDYMESGEGCSFEEART
jgi:hypothetical protein